MNFNLRVYLVAVIMHTVPVFADSVPLTPAQIKSELKSFSGPTRIQGQFSQTKTIKELKLSIHTSGLFEFKKMTNIKNQIIWHMTKPENLNICIDQNKIIFENKSVGKSAKKNILNLSEVSHEESSGLTKLIHFIKLDPDDVGQNFEIRKKNKKLIIKPKIKTEFSFINAEIELDKNKNLKNIMITESNNDEISIEFTKTTEQKIDPSKTNADCE